MWQKSLSVTSKVIMPWETLQRWSGRSHLLCNKLNYHTKEGSHARRKPCLPALPAEVANMAVMNPFVYPAQSSLQMTPASTVSNFSHTRLPARTLQLSPVDRQNVERWYKIVLKPISLGLVCYTEIGDWKIKFEQCKYIKPSSSSVQKQHFPLVTNV